MAKGKIWVGTSGWLYPHWKGTFYPKGLKAKDEFPYYSLFFNTVELNNPFYKLPSRETFESWRINSREDFLFVVKANRFITHMKKLKDAEDALALFLHNCDGLEEKLGPILFQLPPGWQVNTERLEQFLNELPQGYRFVFEFRNVTWYTKEVYALLKKYKCAFCIYQLAGHMSPIEVTTNWVYIRLHGPTNNKYQGSYDFYTLRAWAEKSREWQRKGKDVYIYFDNDDSGYAAFNAQVIDMMLNKSEPITEHEAKVLDVVIRAVKERRKLRFFYRDEEGNCYRTVEPYLVAVAKKGKGDLFLRGYEYPVKKLGGKGMLRDYLLKQVDVKRVEVMDEGFERVHEAVKREEVFEGKGVRVVYTVVGLTAENKRGRERAGAVNRPS